MPLRPGEPTPSSKKGGRPRTEWHLPEKQTSAITSIAKEVANYTSGAAFVPAGCQEFLMSFGDSGKEEKGSYTW